MTASVFLMLFASMVALFLYFEKMKFDPPRGKIKILSWRMAYWGAALAFFSGAVLGNSLVASKALEMIALTLLIASICVVFIGLAIALIWR
ncbi:hypothetical protein [Variovorax sp. Sphag1AA]|uniref:hypothetical protein n=1 Tax=Variovorax sp. Sphag1AA TaxID=2587027 RepID=UPI001613BC83|nr:hypothetical protein [Variovorax sp. Sphag1AA]MBB3177524.1 hypothetical protein [Variovorax sp. Sphag1AA]